MRVFVLPALCALAACGNSFAAPSTPDYPLTVKYPPVPIAGQTTAGQLLPGQYFDEPFPAPSGGPEQSAVLNSMDLEVAQGSAGNKLSSYAAFGSKAVAIGLKSAPKGYWLVPVGLLAADQPGFLGWDASLDFARSLSVGDQPVQCAAADVNGHFGPPQQVNYKITSFIPQGHVVASLAWGNGADLDLHIVTPGGVEVDPKNINSVGIGDGDGGTEAGVPLPGNAQLDRDSNANCFADGYRTENLVWNADLPPAGTYLVRVDMYNACGTPAANFKFTLYVEGVQVLVQDGQLLDVNADGGGPGSGLYIGKFTCDGSGKCS